MNDDVKLKQNYEFSIMDYFVLQRTIKSLSKVMKSLKKINDHYVITHFNILMLVEYFLVWGILNLLCSINKTDAGSTEPLIMLVSLIVPILIFKLIDIKYAIHWLCWFKPNYYKHKNNNPKVINVAFNNAKPIKRLPKYEDIKTFNIPKNIAYLVITRSWFVMFDDNCNVVGYFPQNDSTQHAFIKYVVNECNVKHMMIVNIPSFG